MKESPKVKVNVADLPQMNSIWLDEDQEVEKLYGFQSHFLGSNTDADDDMAIMSVNSNQPFLNNKKKISLPPLVKQKVFIPMKEDTSNKKKKKFLGLFSLKTINNNINSNGSKKVYYQPDGSISPSGKRNISGPYQFQHISHGAISPTKIKHDVNELDKIKHSNDQISETSNSIHSSKKGFRITNNTDEKDSSSSSSLDHKSLQPKRKPSTLNEMLRDHPKTNQSHTLIRYSVTPSTVSSSESNPNSDRIVSTSSMATSFDNVSNSSNIIFNSPKDVTRKNTIDKILNKNNNNKKLNHNSISSTDISVDFLKNYNFPTLIEERQILKFDNQSQSTITMSQKASPMIGRNLTLLDQSDVFINSPQLSYKSQQHNRNRRNSDSLLLTTPQLENRQMFEGTPGSRRSLDDILLYYLSYDEFDSPPKEHFYDSVDLPDSLVSSSPIL